MPVDFGEEILRQIKAPVASAPHAVLPPERDEGGLWNPAMENEFAIEIGRGFPRDDRLQVRRPEHRRAPLRHGEVRDAGEPDAAAAPGLRGGPFDEFAIVLGVPVGEHADLAFRFVHAAHVGQHHGVTVPHPIERIRRLEAGVARNVDIAEPYAREAHEEGGEAVGQLVLAIRRHRHDHRRRLAVGRPK